MVLTLHCRRLTVLSLAIALLLASSSAFAATSEPDLDLAFKLLSRDDRSEIRRYVNQGGCPATLKKSHVPHFYELCIKQLGEKLRPAAYRGGFLSDRIKARRIREREIYIPQSKLRMEVIKQSRESSLRRLDIQKNFGKPIRPRDT